MRLEERLEGLERKCRRLRNASVLMAIFLLSAVLAGATMKGKAGEIVSAQAFIVTDKNREPSVLLSRDGIVFFGKDYNRKNPDKYRIRLGFDSQSINPELRFRDKSGATRILLNTRDRNPAVVMYDTGRKARLLMGMIEKRGPVMVLFDDKGKPGWVARPKKIK